MNFNELIAPEIAARLEARGIVTPSPIQEESLPHTLAGRDLIGRARTGTGKTLAFALPIIQNLAPSRERARLPRAVVVAPTRELAIQIHKDAVKFGERSVPRRWSTRSSRPPTRICTGCTLAMTCVPLPATGWILDRA